jgi:hypothetical protein
MGVPGALALVAHPATHVNIMPSAYSTALSPQACIPLLRPVVLPRCARYWGRSADGLCRRCFQVEKKQSAVAPSTLNMTVPATGDSLYGQAANMVC